MAAIVVSCCCRVHATVAATRIIGISFSYLSFSCVRGDATTSKCVRGHRDSEGPVAKWATWIAVIQADACLGCLLIGPGSMDCKLSCVRVYAEWDLDATNFDNAMMSTSCVRSSSHLNSSAVSWRHALSMAVTSRMLHIKSASKSSSPSAFKAAHMTDAAAAVLSRATDVSPGAFLHGSHGAATHSGWLAWHRIV